MDCRKVTFKLYPNASEAERLTAWVRLHYKPKALAVGDFIFPHSSPRLKPGASCGALVIVRLVGVCVPPIGAVLGFF